MAVRGHSVAELFLPAWGLRALLLGLLFALPVWPATVIAPASGVASSKGKRRHLREESREESRASEGGSGSHKHHHRHRRHHKHKGSRKRKVTPTVNSTDHANQSNSVKVMDATQSMIGSSSKRTATAGALSDAKAVARKQAELRRLHQELEKMKVDLKLQPWEMSLNSSSRVSSNITALNATFFHSMAARREITDADLKKQLHLLCDMLGQLEASEAVKKEAGQKEIDALKEEVAVLREEIERCKAEEEKKLKAAKASGNTPAEVAPAPAPAAVIEYDCDAGYPNWKLGWSQTKKEFCCKKRHMGCEFDCDAGFSNWKRGWSEKKKEYCCQEEQKGCKEAETTPDIKEVEEKEILEEKNNGSFNETGDVPENATEPFDCDAGLSNFERGWSEEKKDWCCKEKSKGCAFDCETGVDNWERGWSEDKKVFCCEYTNVGCKFDCEAGFSKWEKGWSEEKKEWCCVNKNKPTCPPEPSEPEANFTSTSLMEENTDVEPAAPATPAAPQEAALEDGPLTREETPEVVHEGEPADEVEPAADEEPPPPSPDRIEPPMPEDGSEARTVGEWDRPDHASPPREESSFDVDGDMPYGDLEPFGREDTAQELTEASIKESDEMVDQLERAEVAEEKRAVFRALTRLRGAAITSFDGIARSQTGNIDEYNKQNQWRGSHPLHHLADEESDVNKWAFPEDCD